MSAPPKTPPISTKPSPNESFVHRGEWITEALDKHFQEIQAGKPLPDVLRRKPVPAR